MKLFKFWLFDSLVSESSFLILINIVFITLFDVCRYTLELDGVLMHNETVGNLLT